MTNPLEIITDLFLNKEECAFYKTKTIQITPEEAYLHAQRTALEPRTRRLSTRIPVESGTSGSEPPLTIELRPQREESSMPQPPNCPICDQSGTPTTERTSRGVRWAYYLCPNNHPFGVHWLLPAIPVDPPDQEAS